jgi:hypothetical protein
MEAQAIATKTFKDVHAEIENENLFLHRNHDINNFKSKADFLESIGFTNSIATRLYSAIAKNHEVIQQYNQKYLGQYKFILKPQLERVCEKYNLFVRGTEFFLGDIPEKNIRDIMGFSAFVEDLPINERVLYNQCSHLLTSSSALWGNSKDARLPIKHFAEARIGSLIQIAAIKSLFDERAFEKSNARILNKAELSAKHQVDLDPIVLCETKHGYIIITAWGDEANDELVVNQNHN